MGYKGNSEVPLQSFTYQKERKKKKAFTIMDAILRISLEGGVGSKTRGCSSIIHLLLDCIFFLKGKLRPSQSFLKVGKCQTGNPLKGLI